MLGKGVSDGIGIGYAKIINKIQAKYSSIQMGTKENELNRLNDSIEKLYSTFTNKQKMDMLDKEQQEVLFSHMVFLKDPAVLEKLEEYIDAGLSAEASVAKTYKEYSDLFLSVDDKYMAQRSDDILDISNRLICQLQNKSYYDIDSLSEDSILVAKEITPTMLINIGNRKIEGIIVESCGEVSHSVIMARALGIPMVISSVEGISDGDDIIINGCSGQIIQEPNSQERQSYIKRKENISLDNKELKKYINKHITYNNEEMRFMANISSDIDVQNAGLLNINGIGILRTECLFMSYAQEPTEDEQYKVYCDVAEKLNNECISIRVFDIGGDKNISCFDTDNVSFDNRGIRYCLSHLKVFRTQLRAILRASGLYKNIQILLPFISSVEEIDRTKAIIEELKAELLSQSIAINESIRLGAMIETPSAVFLMDMLSKKVDFFSVGTNDLTHFLLVSERFSENNIAELSPYHPAILRCIYYIIDKAHSENKPVALCGEVAANPKLIPIWLAFGIHILSVTPALILKTKRSVCNVIKDSKEIDLQSILECSTTAEVDALIN